ncbi:MAG TPA: tetratricopeptide repeat protein [Bacteroidales bacterium]|nr:tetratricopeptide repeat protein [Bacteroidales bacterium]
MEDVHFESAILQYCDQKAPDRMSVFTIDLPPVFPPKILFNRFILFILFSTAYHCFSQSITSDKSNSSEMLSDTAKVNNLVRQADQMICTDAEKSLILLQEALVLSTELNYKKGIGNSYLWLGRAYYYMDEYKTAGEYLAKARVIFEELDDIEGLVRYHFFQGSIYQVTGNLLSAMQAFHLGIELSKSADNPEMLILNYCALGSIHLVRCESELAMSSFNEARTLMEETGREEGMPILLSNIANTYELIKAYDSALYYYNKSHAIRMKDGGVRGIASSEMTLGRLLIKMGKYREALDYLESSLIKFTDLKDDVGICCNTIEIAKINSYLGGHEKAVELGTNAVKRAEKLKNPELISQTYASFSEIMASDGRYMEAYQYLLKHNYLLDSLAVVNNKKTINELEVQFQTSRKEDKIQLLKSQNEIQRKNNLLVIVLFSTLTIMLVLLLVLFRLKWCSVIRQRKLLENESTIRKQENELRVKEQELLKAQLEAKNRELASKAIDMLRTNETIESIIQKLENIKKINHEDQKLTAAMHSIVSELELRLKRKSWDEFEKIFINIHSGFYQKLLKVCPDLTASEIKIAALLKLNLSTKEIAAIAFKSESGIKSTRFRLRKKLGLSSDDKLVPYLMQL